MRVNRVQNNYYKGMSYSVNKIGKPVTFSPSKDSISFNGVGTTLSVLVAKEGYKTLTTTLAKAKFADELAANFLNPDTANNAKQIVTTLFALVKAPAKNEPDSLIYYAFRKGGVQGPSLAYMRSQALKTLFPLVPELPNDKNSGHAAKVALLNSLVDTGEYFDSDTFCDAFAKLPSKYKEEKLALIKKLLKDSNVQNETFLRKLREKADNAAYTEREIPLSNNPFTAFPALCYALLTTKNWKSKYIKQNYGKFVPDAYKRTAVANIVLISTMKAKEYPTLTEDYGEIIQEQAIVAFAYIKNLLQKTDGKVDPNKFYSYYASGFTSTFLEDPLNDYERRLARYYFFDCMSSLYGNKNAIKKEFNLNDDDYYEDLVKDYELVLATQKIKDIDKLKDIYNERISEKIADGGPYVHDSGKGLIYISGRENELASLLKDDEDKEETYNNDNDNDSNTTYYDNDDTDDLESWERASLETPWIVL